MLAGSALITGALVALSGGQSAYAACNTAGSVISCTGSTTTTQGDRTHAFTDTATGSVTAGSTIDGSGLGISTTGDGHSITFTNDGSISNSNSGGLDDALNLTTSGDGSGITYTGSGDLTSDHGIGLNASTAGGAINITTGAGSDIQAAGISGILAVANGGTGSVSVTNAANVGKDSSPVDKFGILAESLSGGSGAVSIDNSGDIYTTGATGYSLGAIGGTGGASVTNSGTLHADNGLYGIVANELGASGGVTISNTNTGVILGSSTAGIGAFISDSSNTDDITVTNNGSIGADGNEVGGYGIYVNSIGKGTLTASNYSNNSIHSAGDGIHVVGLGNVIANNGNDANNSDGLIDSSAGNGIYAESTGNGTSVEVNTGSTSSITAHLDGIRASNTGTDGTVNVANLGDIAAGGDGIRATGSDGAAVTVTSGADASIAAGGDGIHAWSSTGSVEVTNHGGIGASGTAVGDEGIHAVSGGGPVEVTNDGYVHATEDGIHAGSYGGGGVTVTNGDGTNTVFLSSENGDGIHAFVTGGDGTLSVTNKAHTEITATNDDGISAFGSGSGTVSVENYGGITAGDQGIRAISSGGGDVTVTSGLVANDSNASISADDDGIHAWSSDGKVKVDNFGSIDAGDEGIHAVSGGSGSDAVTVTSTGSVSAVNDGIHAGSYGGGGVTVTNGDGTNAITLSSTDGDGIHAFAVGDGDVDVTNEASATIHAGDDGIRALAARGDVIVTNDGNIGTDVARVGDDGVSASSILGNVTVNTGDDSTIYSTDHGIFARVTANDAAGSGDVTVTTGNASAIDTVDGNGITAVTTRWSPASKVGVTTGTDSTIVSKNGSGIVASTYDDASKIGVIGNQGDVTVTTGTGSSITAGTYGIYATGGDSNVHVASNGDIDAGLDGIHAAVDTGFGEVNVKTAAGTTITADDYGIYAYTSGSGAVSVEGKGSITSGLDGIHAQIDDTASSGLLSVTTGTGTIDAGGNGVFAGSNGVGSVTVTANGSITGDANGVYAASINGAGTGDVKVTVNGSVTGNGTASASYSGYPDVNGIGVAAGTLGQGDVGVTTNSGSSVSGLYAGIVAADLGTGPGDVTVNAHGAVAATNDISVGIGAFTLGTGAVEVTTDSAATVDAGVAGIVALAANTANAAAVTVDADAAITTTHEFGVGIGALTLGTGAVNVTTGSNAEINAGVAGIVALAANDANTNDVTVEANGAITTTHAYGVGIGALTLGTGAVDVTTGSDAEINAGLAGILAVAANTGDNGDVTVDAGGAITTTNADGVGIGAIQLGTGGGIGVTTGADATVDSAGVGILALTTNAGNAEAIDIDVGAQVTSGKSGVVALGNGTGDVTITTAEGASVAATGKYGILGFTHAGDVKITSNDAVSGGDTGIAGATDGDGVVTITANKAVTGTTGDGIRASSEDGAIDVTVNDTVNAGDDGVQAVASGAGAVTVTNYGEIGQSGTTVGGRGIDARSVDGTVAVYNYGNSIYSVGDGVHAVAGGDVTVDNGDPAGVNPDGLISSTSGDGIDARSFGGSVTVTSTAGSQIFAGDDGIAAASFGGVASVNNDGAIGTAATRVGGDGIQAFGGGVAIDNQGSIYATGDGIRARDFGGNTVVTSGTADAGVTIDALNGDGIDARSFGGSVGVTAYGTIDASNDGGTGGRGIYARATGDGTVGVANHAAITSDDDGIYARTFTGAATVDNFANVTSNGGDGIHLRSFGGADLGVTNEAGVSILAAGDGVFAHTTDAGAVTVINYGEIGAADDEVGGRGVDARSGTGLVQVANYGFSIHSLGDGIHAVSGGSVTVDNGGGDNPDGLISSVFGDGIDARSTGAGTVTVNNNADSQILAGDDGIHAWSSTGLVKVLNDGLIGSADTPVGGEGIHAASGGTGDADNDAVFVQSTGTIWSTGTGIRAAAYDGGGLTVSALGDVTSTTGTAIRTSSDLDATINIGSDADGRYADIRGAGSDANPVIDVTTGADHWTDLYVDTGSTVASNDGYAADLAIRGSGAGSTYVGNEGRITGRVDFSAISGTGWADFHNYGRWYTAGTSTFSPNDDHLLNGSDGKITTAGATTFAFGGGTDDYVENNGRLVVGDLGGAESLTATDLEFFDNYGTIVLGGAHHGWRTDGETNDVLAMPGTAFYGEPGESRLKVDAYLGGPGSQSDKLVLTGGSTSGQTSVAVNDTNPGPGAFNPNGTVVVDVNGGVSHAGDFVLDPGSSWYDASLFGGVLNKPGLYFYDLAYNDATQQHVLISAPNPTAMQMPSIVTGAQDLWYHTSPWLDRQADMRDVVNGGQGSGTPGVWMKALGNFGSRSGTGSYSVLNKTYSVDTGYDQNIGGTVGGVDLGRRDVFAPGDTLLGGVMAGYVWSEMNFNTGGTNVEFTGPVLGLYGTYMRNGFFVDGQFKADILSAKIDGPSAQSFSETVHATSLGGMIDAGQRFQLGTPWGAFLEPLATVAYVHTEIGSFATQGTTVHFEDGDSLRGSLGLRVGGQPALGSGDYTVEVSATGRVWNEFLDDSNNATLDGGGPNVELQHDFDGLFGEVGGSINVISKNTGWSGFLNGGYEFSDNYSNAKVVGGVRYHF